MAKLRIIGIITAMLFSLPSNLWAGLSEQMDDLFGSMMTSTDPGGYKSQRRGTIAGGSVAVRNKIYSTNIMDFTPPRMDAGCGGVDFFGGSFSFIDADEFVSLVRSIGSNSAGYAIKLGLSSICPTCSSTIESLQKAVREINELASNSCKIAQELVHTTGLTPEYKGEQLEGSFIASAAKNIGSNLDSFATYLDELGKKPNSQEVPEGTLKDLGYVGNITWNVLTKGNRALDWFDHSDNELGRILMSLVGTVITKTSSDGDTPVVVESFSPTLTFEELWGSTDKEDSQVGLYKCMDDEDACMNIQEQEKEIETMVSRVSRLLLGSDSTTGIVDKYIFNTGSLSDEEKKFLEAIPEHGKRIRDLAISNPASARIYAKEAAETIALELVENWFYQVFSALGKAFARCQEPMSQTMQENMAEIRTKIEQTKQTIRIDKSATADLGRLYQDLNIGGSKKYLEVLDVLEQRKPVQDGQGSGAEE